MNLPQPKLLYPAKYKKRRTCQKQIRRFAKFQINCSAPREQGLLENVQRAAGLGRPAASRRSVLAGLPIFGFQQNRHLTQNSVRFFFFICQYDEIKIGTSHKNKEKIVQEKNKNGGLPRQDAMTNRPCAVVIPYKGRQSVTCSARPPVSAFWQCRLPSWVRPSRPDWSGARGRCPVPARAHPW